MSFSHGSHSSMIPLPAVMFVASPAATSAFNATIFSISLEDIVGLPLDSNSRKVGVSRYFGTNGVMGRLFARVIEWPMGTSA